jgi:hypothetical protein
MIACCCLGVIESIIGAAVLLSALIGRQYRKWRRDRNTAGR